MAAMLPCPLSGMEVAKNAAGRSPGVPVARQRQNGHYECVAGVRCCGVLGAHLGTSKDSTGYAGAPNCGSALVVLCA